MLTSCYLWSHVHHTATGTIFPIVLVANANVDSVVKRSSLVYFSNSSGQSSKYADTARLRTASASLAM